MTDGALPFQLEVIARSIEHWLEWDNGQRTSEGLTTEDGTHIMSLPVPVWPSHGMFRNWVAVLKAAAAAIETPASVDRNPEGEKPQALSAEHESAAEEADAQIPNDYNAQSPLPAPPDNQ